VWWEGLVTVQTVDTLLLAVTWRTADPTVMKEGGTVLLIAAVLAASRLGSAEVPVLAAWATVLEAEALGAAASLQTAGGTVLAARAILLSAKATGAAESAFAPATCRAAEATNWAASRGFVAPMQEVSSHVLVLEPVLAAAIMLEAANQFRGGCNDHVK